MSLKTVYGIIGFDEHELITALKGSGDWTVVRNQKGVYTVTFKDSVAFNDTPTVTLTEIYDGTGNNTDPASAVDSGGNIGGVGVASGAVVVWVTSTQFELAVGGGSGDHEDRMVSFMATGSADD